MRVALLLMCLGLSGMGTGCGFFAAQSASQSTASATSVVVACGCGPDGTVSSASGRRRSPGRSGGACAVPAGPVAVLFGDAMLPLTQTEAATVTGNLRRWYLKELAAYARRSPQLSAEVARLSTSNVLVSLSRGAATFYLDGFQLVRGRLVAAPRLRNGRPDRGEAALVDLSGASSIQAAIPDLGTFAGRSLDLTATRERCVPERSDLDVGAVSAALSALAMATRD